MTPKLTKFYQFVHTKSKFHVLFLLYCNFSRSIIGFHRLFALSRPFAAFRGLSRPFAAFRGFLGLSRSFAVFLVKTYYPLLALPTTDPNQ